MNRTLGKLLFALALCALAFTPGLISPVEAGAPAAQAEQFCDDYFVACGWYCDHCIAEFKCYETCVCC